MTGKRMAKARRKAALAAIHGLSDEDLLNMRHEMNRIMAAHQREGHEIKVRFDAIPF